MLEGYERDRAQYTASALPRAAVVRFDWLLDYLPLRALVLLALLSPALVAAPTVAFALVWFAVLFGLNLTFHASVPHYHIDEYAPLIVLVCAGFLAAVRGLRRAHFILPSLAALGLAFYYSLFGTGIAAAFLLLLIAYAFAAWAVRRKWHMLREWSPVGLAAVAALLAAAACVRMPASARHSRMPWEHHQALRERFAALVGELRKRPTILLVHGTEEQLLQLPLVNPRLGAGDPQPLIAVDLGGRNAELMARFPGREALRLDVGTWSLEPLGRALDRQAGEIQSISR
jgi:hypothetical protein